MSEPFNRPVADPSARECGMAMAIDATRSTSTIQRGVGGDAEQAKGSFHPEDPTIFTSHLEQPP
jgi:hypothetical protein